MPINYLQLQDKIREMGQNAPRLQREKLERLELARQTLAARAHDLEALCARVQQAAALNNKLRCALPVSEELTLARHAPSLPAGLTLLAADGSQINPSAHDAVPFGIINVSVFEMHPGSGEAPLIHLDTELLTDEKIFTDFGMMGEETIALKRDLREREMLLGLASGRQPPVVTLTDGPLELFREPKNEQEYDKAFTEYVDVLDKMANEGVVAAGFVEKSRSDLVIRLLEISLLPDAELASAGVQRPLKYITDIELYRTLLQPGQRSAIFAIQSGSKSQFSGRLAVNFFYLNISNTKRPYLARVELPRWAAESGPMVDLLQSALLWQCQQMGPNASPYALHRAHETAVVGLDEREKVENMILSELRRLNLGTDEKSHKQANKELPGKGKHK